MRGLVSYPPRYLTRETFHTPLLTGAPLPSSHYGQAQILSHVSLTSTQNLLVLVLIY